MKDHMGWIEEELEKLALATGYTPNRDRLVLYAQDLVDFDAEILAVTFYHARREFTEFPPLAELIELVKSEQRIATGEDGFGQEFWRKLRLQNREINRQRRYDMMRYGSKP